VCKPLARGALQGSSLDPRVVVQGVTLTSLLETGPGESLVPPHTHESSSLLVTLRPVLETVVCNSHMKVSRSSLASNLTGRPCTLVRTVVLVLDRTQVLTAALALVWVLLTSCTRPSVNVPPPPPRRAFV